MTAPCLPSYILSPHVINFNPHITIPPYYNLSVYSQQAHPDPQGVRSDQQIHSATPATENEEQQRKQLLFSNYPGSKS